MREALHDLQFVGGSARSRRRAGGLRVGLHLQFEDLFLLAAEHRQDAVRRQLVQRLAEIEIVLELLALGLLAVAHRRGHHAVRPHLLAQRPDQIGVLGETLDQDRARAVERCGDIGHLLFGIDETGGHDLRIVLRLRQQQLRQRLEAGFLGDLGLGAALRLERQIDVFQASLAVGGEDRGFQRGIELALFADRIENRGAALFEFAQIVQALFQRAQLRVVERAGDFLAVARNERHRGAAVEQRHRRLDLLLANAEFLRNLPMNICHAKSFQSSRGGRIARRGDAAYGPSRIDSSTRRRKQIDLWIGHSVAGVIQPGGSGTGVLRSKIKVDRWRRNV